MPVESGERQILTSRSVLARAAGIGGWVGAIALLLFVLDLLGVPVGDWIRKLFKDVRAVPASAVVDAIVLDTVQTVFAALSWVTILRAAFPDVRVPWRPVLASYAVAVALNGFLPANIGTLVMMVIFVSLIAGATFATILSGFVVQKSPFTVLSVASYIHLFTTVSGSLSIKLGLFSPRAAEPVLRYEAIHGQRDGRTLGRDHLGQLEMDERQTYMQPLARHRAELIGKPLSKHQLQAFVDP